MSFKKDYAKLGFIAYWTGLHAEKIEEVLESVARYEELQKKKETDES